MNFGLIHLTDLHLEKTTDISNKIKSLCSIIKSDLSNVSKKYLIISGDIVNSGEECQFDNAEKILKNIIKDCTINETIIVPGNHDCNFKYDDQSRKNSLNNIDYNILGNDGSIIEQALKVQKDFWGFYSKFNKLPDNKLAYIINDNIDGINISFKCLNTSWMSSRQEKVGTLFFPTKTIMNFDDSTDISISVFHHPVNWFSPNKDTNNKNELQDFLDNISNIKLIGHEHENKSISRTDLDSDINVLDFSGEIFNNNIDSHSGFQTFKISTEKNEILLKKYLWEDDLYLTKYEKEIPLQTKSKRKLKIKELFLNELNDIKIPLEIERKPVSLSQVYVYPDLQEKKEDFKELDSFIDSRKLLEKKIFNKVILAGDSQIGKTSLLSILFQEFYSMGFYPFLLKGEDIKNIGIDKLIKKHFNQIYSDNSQFDRYVQMENDKKVILIDDFHRNNLKGKNLKQIIEEISNKYAKIIIVTDSSVELSADVQFLFKDYDKLTIKPLGYKKTDDLIEKYFECKSVFSSLNEQGKLSKIKSVFNQVRGLLGDKILPSYPLFILSLLRTLDDTTYSLSETSYGYCYESLLYFAFKSRAMLNENQLTYYLSFIEKLAFDLFEKNKTNFDDIYLNNFYDEYKRNHIIGDFFTIEKNLLDSCILKKYDNTYKYGYKYIYYYLAAKHIAGIIDSEKGKNIIKNLFDKLYLEENANILVFVTHHTKDNNFFIEEAVLKAMEPFESIEPITLKKDCDYYSLISGLKEDVKNEILETDISPNKRRKEILEKFDNSSKESDNYDFYHNEAFRPYITAFKAIDIVSQIIKNRVGYLKKKDLVYYINELYLTGFRMIGAIGETYNNDKEEIVGDIVNSIIDDIEKKAKNREYLLEKSIDRSVIKEKVNNFFEVINLQICLCIFSKLVDSAGINDNKVKEIYYEVAETINSPAAQLVTFSINSYYYGLSVEEIKDYAKKFKDNPVALKILKSSVISYVYSNHLDFKKKQQISEILKLKLKPCI